MSLKNGSRGQEVRQLQEKLGIAVDGKFGPDTELAVKTWQASHGLIADGIVGKLTWGKLFEVGNFGDLEQDDLHSDDDDENGDGADDDDNAQFAAIDGLELNALKGRVPDVVLAQIPQTAEIFAINTRLRLAHFLAQVAHESGGFKFTFENLNYSAKGLRKTFPSRFPGDLADSYAGQRERIAARVYANKIGNGDEASKDGWTYRGRGYIQLTGKANYQAFDASVDDNILANPDLVATKYPLLSAAWFWNGKSLNRLADEGADDETVTAITIKINGGTNGLDDRLKRFKEYYRLLG